MSSRREVLGAGVALAVATAWPGRFDRALAVAHPARAGRQGVVAVARTGDGYAGLVRAGDEATDLRRLALAPDDSLRPADQLGPPLPAGVHPIAVAAGASGLLVGGGRTVTIGQVPTLADSSASVLDHLDPAYEADETRITVTSLSAALFEVTAEALEEIALPSELTRSSFSVVEALAQGADGMVRALVAHNAGDEEARYAANLSVVTIAGSLATDTGGLRDLGESGPNHLISGPGRAVEVVVNRDDATYGRIHVDQTPAGSRSVSAPRAGRVTAVFEHGVVVEHPDTGSYSWDSPTDHPAPPILTELATAADGSPALLPIAGESHRAVAVSDDRLVLVEI